MTSATIITFLVIVVLLAIFRRYYQQTQKVIRQLSEDLERRAKKEIEESNNAQEVAKNFLVKKEAFLEEVQLHEQLNKMILKNVSNGIITINEKGIVETFNPAAEIIFGYSADEFIGRNVKYLMGESDASRHDNYIQSYLRTGKGKILGVGPRVVQGRRKNGESFPMQLSSSELDPGRRFSFIGSVVDLTEIKAQENKIRQLNSILEGKNIDAIRGLASQQQVLEKTHENLEVAQRLAHIGCWDWGIEENILTWSDEIFRIFGLQPGETHVSYENFLKAVHQDDRDAVSNAVRSSVAIDAPYSIEHRIVRPNGSIRNVHERGKITRNDAGVAIRMQGTVHDITMHKNNEDLLRQTNNKLQKKLEELDTVNKELEKSFLSIAHGFRTPLRTIDGLVKALVEDDGKNLGSDGETSIRYISEGCQELSVLIDGLLMLSWVVQSNIFMEEVNLSEILTEIVKNLRQTDPERNVVIDIAPKAAVLGDRRQLKMMLENLFSNAWKYTRTRKEAYIEFVTVQLDGILRDNGIGFDATHKNKLFVPFQRLHSKQEFEGIGMGLAVVQRIINRHGGTVLAEGVVGQGAAFTFELNTVEKFNE